MNAPRSLPAAQPPRPRTADNAVWELLRSTAIRTLRAHVNDHGRCLACGNIRWPCEQALLGDANLALLDGTMPAGHNRRLGQETGEPS